MPYRAGRRWMTLVSYLLFIAAGVVSFLNPLASFTATLSSWLVVVWSFVLLAGGTLGVVGVIRRSPGLEFAGLPWQTAAIAVAGVVFIWRGVLGGTPPGTGWGTVVVGMLMLALAAKLLARWFDIGSLVRGRRRDGGR
jgi:hypothetical protein